MSNTQFDIDTGNGGMQDEFHNLFGISLRGKRKSQQLEDIKALAKEQNISEEEVKKMLRAETQKSKDSGTAIGSVLQSLSEGILKGGLAKADSTRVDTTRKSTDLDKFEKDREDKSDIRILGMKPLVFGLASVGVIGLAVFGIIKLSK